MPSVCARPRLKTGKSSLLPLTPMMSKGQSPLAMVGSTLLRPLSCLRTASPEISLYGILTPGGSREHSRSLVLSRPMEMTFDVAGISEHFRTQNRQHTHSGTGANTKPRVKPSTAVHETVHHAGFFTANPHLRPRESSTDPFRAPSQGLFLRSLADFTISRFST